MVYFFALIDSISPYVEKRAASFGLQPGMCLIDYGCGPGRYTLRFSRLVGETGQVFAVDIHELAIASIQKMIARDRLKNVHPVLAQRYSTGIPAAVADRIFALDMFFAVRQPTEFLAELRRLIKPEGLLIIDDGHQPREATRRKLLASGQWKIESENKDHLECRPL